jgi:hypothetical protein
LAVVSKFVRPPHPSFDDKDQVSPEEAQADVVFVDLSASDEYRVARTSPGPGYPCRL